MNIVKKENEISQDSSAPNFELPKIPLGARIAIKAGMPWIKKFIAYSFEKLNEIQKDSPVTPGCVRNIQLIQINDTGQVLCIVSDLNPVTGENEKIIFKHTAQLDESGIDKMLITFINSL